jgi:hypothetical protein
VIIILIHNVLAIAKVVIVIIVGIIFHFFNSKISLKKEFVAEIFSFQMNLKFILYYLWLDNFNNYYEFVVEKVKGGFRLRFYCC